MEAQGLRTAVVLGPHPAELVRLVEGGMEPGEAAELMERAYDLAAKYVEEGRAAGLGEVGRPHWPVPRKVVEACNEVLDHVLALSRDLGCLVHIHMEPGREGIDDLRGRVKRVGAGRVVVHHIRGDLAGYAAPLGLHPSVPAKEGEVVRALGSRFVVESDFLDDPRRPGAVVAPWSIGRPFSRLISRGVVDEGEAERVLVDNIAELYGVEPP